MRNCFCETWVKVMAGALWKLFEKQYTRVVLGTAAAIELVPVVLSVYYAGIKWTTTSGASDVNWGWVSQHAWCSISITWSPVVACRGTQVATPDNGTRAQGKDYWRLHAAPSLLSWITGFCNPLPRMPSGCTVRAPVPDGLSAQYSFLCIPCWSLANVNPKAHMSSCLSSFFESLI